MIPSGCYQQNAPKVVSEVIDGELVLIDFDSGSYFSSNLLGARIWELIEQGQPIDVIQKTVAALYSHESLDLSSSTLGFVEQLIDKNLIVAAEPRIPPVEISPCSDPIQPVNEGPVLQEFEDMQELLLLDPIHDTDEAGWPMATPEGDGDQS